MCKLIELIESRNKVLVLLSENRSMDAIALISKLKLNKWNINNFLLIGADVNACTFIEYLVTQRGANVNAKDHMDENSIFRASKSNSKEAFELLMGYGSNYIQTNKAGYNCLMGMVNSPLIVKKIIKDFDIHHSSKDGKTALSMALKIKNYEIIKLIIRESSSMKDILLFKKQVKNLRDSKNKNICDYAYKEISAIELKFKLEEDLPSKSQIKKIKI